MFKNLLKSLRFPGVLMFSVFWLASSGGGSGPSNSLSPIPFVPGYGMGALHVAVSDVRGEVANPLCEIREFEFVGHMDIFETPEVLRLLVANARDIPLGIDSCR